MSDADQVTVTEKVLTRFRPCLHRPANSSQANRPVIRRNKSHGQGVSIQNRSKRCFSNFWMMRSIAPGFKLLRHQGARDCICKRKSVIDLEDLNEACLFHGYSRCFVFIVKILIKVRFPRDSLKLAGGFAAYSGDSKLPSYAARSEPVNLQ